MQPDTITTGAAKVPKVGLGTYLLTGKEGTKSIQDALQAGYRHIDTAQAYGNEEEVGKAVKNSGISREKIFITTKVMPANFKILTAATEVSLKRLNTDYADLLLLHWASDDETNKKGVDLLNEVLKKGYVINIGVSNFTLSQIAKAFTQAPIVTDQVEYHPYLSQQKMLNYLRERNMFLTAYSPLALGKVMKDATLQVIASRYKRTVSQVVLRWLVQQGDVAVIPKASSTERRKENLNIFDFELADNDMEAVFRLSRNQRLANPAWAPEWD